MRKTKEVLRLRFEVGWGCGRSPVVVRLASGPSTSICNEPKRRESRGRLGRIGTKSGWRPALFGGPPRARPAALPMPDFAEFHQQRLIHPHLTQQLLWEKYRQANPDGYRYSRFCELFKRWRRKQDMVLRQEHKAGEKLFVVPCSRRICSSLYWEPAPIPMPRPPATNSYRTGSARTRCVRIGGSRPHSPHVVGKKDPLVRLASG